MLEAFVEDRTGLSLMDTQAGSVGKPHTNSFWSEGSKRSRRAAPPLPPSARPSNQPAGGKRKRHICPTEEGIYAAANLFAAKLPKEVPRLKGGMLYARFRSISEEIENSLRVVPMGPPPGNASVASQ